MSIDITKWKDARILVIGDIILDVFKEGKIRRINPESPASQLIDIHATKECLGGAANVANNLASIGCKVTLHGLANNDTNGKRLQELTEEAGIKLVINSDGRPTTTKTRLVETTLYHQIARVDEENKEKISKEVAQQAVKKIKKDVEETDAVLFSDYNKGFLTKELTQEIISLCKEKNIPVLVDFRPINIENFKGCTVICPNIYEAQEVTGITITRTNGLKESEELKEMCRKLKEKANSEFSIITCGKDGIISMNREGKFDFSHTEAKKIFDVIGAGDTVMAIFGACFAQEYKNKDINLHEITKLANIAGKIVVGKVGTSTTTIEEIQHELKESTS